MGGDVRFEAIRRLGIVVAFLVLGLVGLAADPVVSNVGFAQRPGTKLVDISYDLAADEGDAQVSVAISGDGGATWTVPVTSVTGASGSNVVPGMDKAIVWNGGMDWDGVHTVRGRVRITALAMSADGDFVRIPGGTNSGTDPDFGAYSLTVEAVFMARNLVTKGKWDEVRAWGLSNSYTDLPGGSGLGETHPVHSVNWYDAVKWCNARSEKEGRTPSYTVSGAVYRIGNSDNVACNTLVNGYRLPTEMEWEYAGRGGLSGMRFPWGNTISHSQANYYSQSQYSYDISPTRGYHPAYYGYKQPYTSPVGSFPANAYGLHDMAGNVAEWCWDQHPDNAARRVQRNNAWGNSSYFCRVGRRNGSYPDQRSTYAGFRSCWTASAGALAVALSGKEPLDFRDYTLEVSSPYPAPTPGVGSHAYAWHATVTCGVADASAAYTPTGWTGTGSVPATGTALTTGSLVLDEVDGSTASSIAWHWRGPPVAVADAYTALSNVALTVTAADGVLSNDISYTSAELTAVLVSAPDSGSVAVNADGSFTYTPGVGFIGTDAFSYRADDSTAGSDSVTVMITVVQSHAVVFSLGTHGSRTGGGELAQVVAHGSAAVEPTFKVEDNWSFVQWNCPFSSIDGDLVVTAEYVLDLRGLYLVVDLSGGPEATAYPVSWLDSAPPGGWSDGYKTTKLVLRRVAEGSFTMGAPDGELGGGSGETQHRVTLTQDFYMGVFEVTQQQWERVMGVWPSYFSNESIRATLPVECVSWDSIRGGVWPGTPVGSGQPAADTFVSRLRARTRFQTIDLPTEAQWEYACRAGTTTALNSGKNLTDTGHCSNMDKLGRYWYSASYGTATVGSYLPNGWGLYDMHGNAFEWCLDWNGPYQGIAADPMGAATGSTRIVRGGAMPWMLKSVGRRAATIPPPSVSTTPILVSAFPGPFRTTRPALILWFSIWVIMGLAQAAAN